MFKGCIVAIVTPFKNGKVDESKLRELVQFHFKNGTNGIVPCGTTGESPTLSHDEHKKVIEICIEESAGRIPIIAGTGSNSTREAVSLTQHAAKAGAQGALVVTPYYNKPTQEGIYQHFKAIADSSGIKIVLYNIPGRTSKNIEPETMLRLKNDCSNIVGVKEAAGSLDQMQTIKALCGPDFILLSGDDALTLPLLSIGGVGVVSVVANIVPQDVVKLFTAFNAGDIEAAQKAHYSLLPLVKSLFLETNPIPIKEAMNLLGMCSAELRLPLCPMADGTREKLRSALQDYGLLKGNKNDQTGGERVSREDGTTHNTVGSQG